MSECTKSAFKVSLVFIGLIFLINIYGTRRTSIDFRDTGIEQFPEWAIPLKNINEPRKGICTDISFLVALRCLPGDFELRNTYRKTYGKFALEHKFQIIFLIGLPKGGMNQTDIDQEAKHYGDILQGNYIDSYRNITYKTISSINYHAQHCAPDSVLLKVDDDVFWRVASVSSMVERLKHLKEGIVCLIFTGFKPIRKPSKWTATVEEYPGDSYPPFCQGTTLFMKHQVSMKIMMKLPFTKFFWLDDVYITGVVREAIQEPMIGFDKVMDLPPEHIGVQRVQERFGKQYRYVLG